MYLPLSFRRLTVFFVVSIAPIETSRWTTPWLAPLSCLRCLSRCLRGLISFASLLLLLGWLFLLFWLICFAVVVTSAFWLIIFLILVWLLAQQLVGQEALLVLVVPSGVLQDKLVLAIAGHVLPRAGLALEVLLPATGVDAQRSHRYN